MRFIRYLSVALVFIWHVKATQICNGLAGLCDLTIEQVTLPGTHNSGAGFDGLLYYHKLISVPALSCPYRNQELSFTGQLNLGIRYFDIDLCWDTTYSPASSWICHQAAYGGTVKKMLQQIDEWMNKNPNDVIVIHFNRDSTDGDKTGPDVWQQLEDLWSNTKPGALSIQDRTYSTLGECIKQNKRIFIIWNHKLSTPVQNRYISEYDVGFAWNSKHGNRVSDVKEYMKDNGKERCLKETYGHSFVRYSMYMSWGLCVDDLASLMRPYIKQAVDGCYSGTKQDRRTVNFILVDYADQTVVNVAKELNLVNVKAYSG